MRDNQYWTPDMKPLVDAGIIQLAFSLAGGSFLLGQWALRAYTGTNASHVATYAATTLLISTITFVFYYVIYVTEWVIRHMDDSKIALRTRDVCSRLVFMAHFVTLASIFLLIGQVIAIVTQGG